MSDPVDLIARAIYELNPAIHGLDDHPFDFGDPRASYSTGLALKQAAAVVEALGGLTRQPAVTLKLADPDRSIVLDDPTDIRSARRHGVGEVLEGGIWVSGWTAA